jgi:hypothetical protein
MGVGESADFMHWSLCTLSVIDESVIGLAEGRRPLSRHSVHPHLISTLPCIQPYHSSDGYSHVQASELR